MLILILFYYDISPIRRLSAISQALTVPKMARHFSARRVRQGQLRRDSAFGVGRDVSPAGTGRITPPRKGAVDDDQPRRLWGLCRQVSVGHSP